MFVFEYQCRVILENPVPYQEASGVLSGFIDRALALEPEYLEYHKGLDYKYYCFDLPYPFERSGIYEKNKIYTIRIRTVKQDLAEYFSTVLPFHRGKGVCGRSGELKIIPKKMLENVFSLTSVVIKTDEGYWKNCMSLLDYEKRLRENLIKKYNAFTGEKIDEDFQFYELIEFKNRIPIKTSYKGISLLGDKLNFVTAKNKTAQDIWYFSLGAGMGDNNSRGHGFLNYRYV